MPLPFVSAVFIEQNDFKVYLPSERSFVVVNKSGSLVAFEIAHSIAVCHVSLFLQGIHRNQYIYGNAELNKTLLIIYE